MKTGREWIRRGRSLAERDAQRKIRELTALQRALCEPGSKTQPRAVLNGQAAGNGHHHTNGSASRRDLRYSADNSVGDPIIPRRLYRRGPATPEWL